MRGKTRLDERVAADLEGDLEESGLNRSLRVGYGLATGVGGSGHDRRDLREDRADGGRNARHNRTGGNGHETSHQSIFDEVLTFAILPNLQLQKQILHLSL